MPLWFIIALHDCYYFCWGYGNYDDYSSGAEIICLFSHMIGTTFAVSPLGFLYLFTYSFILLQSFIPSFTHSGMHIYGFFLYGISFFCVYRLIVLLLWVILTSTGRAVVNLLGFLYNFPPLTALVTTTSFDVSSVRPIMLLRHDVFSVWEPQVFWRRGLKPGFSLITISTVVTMSCVYTLSFSLKADGWTASESPWSFRSPSMTTFWEYVVLICRAWINSCLCEKTYANSQSWWKWCSNYWNFDRQELMENIVDIFHKKSIFRVWSLNECMCA